MFLIKILFFCVHQGQAFFVLFTLVCGLFCVRDNRARDTYNAETHRSKQCITAAQNLCEMTVRRWLKAPEKARK